MPGLSSAVAGFLQSIRGTACGAEPAIENRRELSARYLRELAELVDDRQISAADAQRVARDLFEPAEAGRALRVRLAVWRAYVTERTGQTGLRLVGEVSDSSDRGEGADG